MSTLTCLSPAKLNLFLHITGRRPDGYHSLQTAFQLLDWGDTMQFTPRADHEIRLTMCKAGISDNENLIVRAARLLQGIFPGKTPGADIIVEKLIPLGGGLGGGSSNAATTLLALSHLWGMNIESEKLQSIGAKLGADVPVFVAGYSAWAEGIGDILTPLALPSSWYFIIQPNCHVSTAKIFSHGELTRDTSPIKLAAFFRGSSRNDCQAIVRNLYPEVNNALKWLDKFGESKLTGTGACIFASFETKEEVDTIRCQLPKKWTGYVARGINKSPVLASLH